MRPLAASTVALGLLLLPVPAAAQVASTSGAAYGCAYETTWLEAAPGLAVTVYECGEATCAWVQGQWALLPVPQCVPGGPGADDGRACFTTGASAWRNGAHAYARERRCVAAASTAGGACLVQDRSFGDGRAAYVARECAEAEGTAACRSEDHAWDHGGTWRDRRCMAVEARDEPCGRAVVLLAGDVTGMADAAGGLYPWETRVACAPF